MKLHLVVPAALVALLTLTSVAAAGPEKSRQLVTITAKGIASSNSFGKFELESQQAGPVKSDSGTETATWNSRHVVREGQDVTLGNWLFTLVGKRGKLVLRDRLETVEAGNGYHVSHGTWKVVRGTGQYAQVTGGGRIGGVWLESRPWSERRVGFLTLP
jgi:hypothetical protein